MRSSGSGKSVSAERTCMHLKALSLFLIIRVSWAMSYPANWWNLMRRPVFKKGDIVTFLPYLNCGKCVACRVGKTNCCTTLQVCGVHIDGGMSDFYAVPSRLLVPAQGLGPD